jgi:hypothetical protein
MKFPYREYVGIYPGTDDFRLILRPIITIRILGSRSQARWDALVDTGADETLFPLALAELLGVELDPRMVGVAAGISGDRLKVHYGAVELQIENGPEVVSWKTTVGFADFQSESDEPVILGQDGCLEFFTASFDGENAELELVANSLLPTGEPP